jgi:transposase
MSSAIFKTYSPHQLHLLPPSWEEKIEPTHPVRVVNQVIESLTLNKLYESYEGGGSSSYHPKMLLKALVYAYMSNIYSSRKIEEAIKSNIHFIWLCGNNEPDHNTINRFRGERVATVLKDIFKQIVLLLAEEGLVSLKDVYVDGTKIEANANRYTFVWGKAIKTNKEKMIKQVDELWQYAQTVAREELPDTEPLEFHTIDAEKVRHTIRVIEEVIKDAPMPKKVKGKLRYAKKSTPTGLRNTNEKRNSYTGETVTVKPIPMQLSCA